MSQHAHLEANVQNVHHEFPQIVEKDKSQPDKHFVFCAFSLNLPSAIYKHQITSVFESVLYPRGGCVLVNGFQICVASIAEPLAALSFAFTSTHEYNPDIPTSTFSPTLHPGEII